MNRNAEHLPETLVGISFEDLFRAQEFLTAATRLASKGEFTIVDADGQTVNFRQEVEARFEAHSIDATRTTATVVTFRFYGFPVPDFGAYMFEVLYGEDRLAQVPFWVVPAAQQDGSDQPGEPNTS